MIQGMAITLYNRTQIGVNAFNEPVYEEKAERIENVLVGQPTAQERIDELTLTGRAIEYVLGIPKGDTHNWENQIVEFFGHKFKTFGIPEQGIEANIPLSWHKKVKCERYEV